MGAGWVLMVGTGASLGPDISMAARGPEGPKEGVFTVQPRTQTRRELVDKKWGRP